MIWITDSTQSIFTVWLVQLVWYCMMGMIWPDFPLDFHTVKIVSMFQWYHSPNSIKLENVLEILIINLSHWLHRVKGQHEFMWPMWPELSVIVLNLFLLLSVYSDFFLNVMSGFLRLSVNYVWKWHNIFFKLCAVFYWHFMTSKQNKGYIHNFADFILYTEHTLVMLLRSMSRWKNNSKHKLIHC